MTMKTQLGDVSPELFDISNLKAGRYTSPPSSEVDVIIW